MTVRALSDVAAIIAGQSPPGNTYNDKGDGLPFFQGKAEFGRRHPIAVKWCSAPTKVAEAGDILISVRAPVGPTNVANTTCCIGRGLAAIRAKEGSIDPEYLHWTLIAARPALEAKGNGSTFAAINRNDLAALNVYVPPLDEQRRIVDLLSRAESLKRLAEEAQTKARELIAALFVDMFGDPASNPKGWPVATLGELGIQFVGGKNLQAGPETSDGYRILKISAVTSGTFKGEESKPAPLNYHPPEDHIVTEGDILFSRANTAELVGATAQVVNPPANLLLPDKLWRIELPDDCPCSSQFLFRTLQQPSVRSALSQLATGTSDSMRNISQGRLRTLSIPCPPRREQIEFERRVAAAISVGRLATQGLRAAELTSASLMAHLFAN